MTQQPIKVDASSLIQKFGEEERPPGIACAYAGPTMVGKTRYALTWPGNHTFAFGHNDSTHKAHGTGFPYTRPNLISGHPLNWTEKVLPAIRARAFDAKTLIFDDFDMYTTFLVMDMWKGVGKDARKDLWTPVLNRVAPEIEALTAVKFPDLVKPDLPYYNVVFTFGEIQRTNEAGQVQKIEPTIGGQSKMVLLRAMDITLICERKMVDRQEQVMVELQGKQTMQSRYVKAEKYTVHTIPPDNLRAYGGDRLGGGGKFKKLPAQLDDGFYSTLCDGWGIGE